MNNSRHVKKLLSVFDLPDYGPPGLPERPSIRIMFLYDEEANIKEFKILKKNITADEDSRIRTWLRENVDHLFFPARGDVRPLPGLREIPAGMEGLRQGSPR